ncbi:long-chain fatty acid outer membrane transporter [mine drainage metagenome]|uniref:Long-chain fatty acid outer membrane transporter n=1 Tax=mine drainage metagenome TaxID=410659 RepID=A0A1J5S4N5_9ZZZZ
MSFHPKTTKLLKLKYMKQKFCVALSIIVLMMFSVKVFSQNGTKLIGYDAVTSGRGGTATGSFDNPSLMVNNPAGISFLKSSQLDISVSLMAPSVYFKNNLNDAKGKNNLFPLGCISYVKPGNKKLSYGFGIFTQGGMGADFNMNHYLFTDQSGNYVPQAYHSKFAVMQGVGTIAYKLSKELSVGVTAGVVYSQMEFQMPMNMPPSMLQGVINPQTGFTFGNMFSASPQDGGLGYTELTAAANLKSLSAYEFNGKIGLAYQPSKNFSFGISYTLPVNLHYKNGNAEMDMTAQMNNAFGKVVAGIMYQNPSYTQQQAQQAAMTQFSQLGIDLSKGATDTYSSTATLGLPQSLAAGISFSATKQLRLSMDAEWVNWANAFNTMNISLSGGTNANINRMLGTSGTIVMPFPLNWKDAVVIRTGAEYTASKKLTVRCGYAYGNNPVPESTVFAVFPAVVVHHASIGASYKLSKKVFLNGAYEHAFRNDVTATQNSLIGIQFNNSKSGLSNDIFHVSVSVFLDKK